MSEVRLIDANAVKRGIEELKQSPWYNEKNLDHFPIRKEAVEVIERLCIDNEQTVDAEPKWIPVSERLPEEEGLYFVTNLVKSTNERLVGVCGFYDGRFFELLDGTVPVIAWMPPPKPYEVVTE